MISSTTMKPRKTKKIRIIPAVVAAQAAALDDRVAAGVRFQKSSTECRFSNDTYVVVIGHLNLLVPVKCDRHERKNMLWTSELTRLSLAKLVNTS